MLRTEPDHQQALVILLLALTDRFSRGYGVSDTQAQELLPRLHNDYDRTYYAGIICERKAKARLHQGGPGAGFNAFDLFREAMTWFEKAEKIRPAGNDDALLRWNTCARIIARNQLESRPQESGQLSHE